MARETLEDQARLIFMLPGYAISAAEVM